MGEKLDRTPATGRNYGQSNQGRPGTRWRNQGNWGNEGWFEGFDGPQGMWGTRVPEPGGRHAGAGPRNYKRSDERISDEIHRRLTDADHIDATDVEVRCSGAEVTLLGEIESRQMKKDAEDVVWSVRGVAQVHNQLRVRNAPGMFFNNREQSDYRMQTNPRPREP
jgi:hypothetical protein